MVTYRVLSIISVIALCACSSVTNDGGPLQPNAENETGAFDAGKSTDGSNASGGGYSQWWDPTCKTQAGGCDTSKCRPAQLMVWQTKCGASKTVMAGCIRSDGGTNGWGCYLRPVDGTIIQSMDFPLSFDGLKTCDDAGLTNSHGYFYAECGDGGSD